VSSFLRGPFVYQDPFPLKKDDTEYYLLSSDYVSVAEFAGQEGDGDVITAEEIILGVILFEGKRILVNKRFIRHCTLTRILFPSKRMTPSIISSAVITSPSPNLPARKC
jgi:hypothetical protein